MTINLCYRCENRVDNIEWDNDGNFCYGIEEVNIYCNHRMNKLLISMGYSEDAANEIVREFMKEDK